ncbi:MAG: hypothetical protein ACK4V6_03990 [Microthrixaceae bacterium]
MQVLLVDGTYYYGFPGLPDGIEWASMSADELAEISGIDPRAAGAQDPTKAFEALSAVSDEVEVVGEEQIGGVDTTHYRFTADVSGLFDQAVESGTLGRLDVRVLSTLPASRVTRRWRLPRGYEAHRSSARAPVGEDLEKEPGRSSDRGTCSTA